MNLTLKFTNVKYVILQALQKLTSEEFHPKQE